MNATQPTPMHRAWRKLLVAQIPADFADWLDFVAIGALLAFVWQVDPMVFALLAVAMGLPYLVVGPFAGVVVDRVSVNGVLILSNIGRAVATAGLFLAPDWQMLLLVVALRSAVDTFFTPAKQAAIQAMTTGTDRMRVNGYSHAINQASKIAAPALGGGLLIWIAPQTVFLLNAGVSLLAAMLIWRLPTITRGVADDAGDGIWAQMGAGLAEVNAQPVLRAVLGMMAAGYFAMFFYDTLIAPLVRDIGFSQTHLGLSLAAVGAGGVAGALALGWIAEIRRPFVLITIGAGVGGMVIAALGLVALMQVPLSVSVFIGMFAVLGVMTSLSVVPFRAVLQSNVRASRMGRVTALSEALNTVALLTAPFIGAGIATWLGIGAAFVAGGLVMLGVAWRAMRLSRLH